MKPSLFVFCYNYTGSLIYRVRGIDPDGDKLIFGVREPGDKVIRVENFGRSEANLYLKIELDREVNAKKKRLSTTNP